MAEPLQRHSATTRLDRLLVDRGLFPSREKAAFSIRAGGVRVNGREITKPATPVEITAPIEVNTLSTLRIGRGERKLAGILERFAINCSGKIALDVGSGAGGFTWQLLRHGAMRVYAVDVGSNQLHHDLRADSRVSVCEQTDVRDLKSLPEKPDVAVIDVSFISLRLILPHVCSLLGGDADVVALLKPQFELASIGLKKGDSIRSEENAAPRSRRLRRLVRCEWACGQGQRREPASWKARGSRGISSPQTRSGRCSLTRIEDRPRVYRPGRQTISMPRRFVQRS